MDGYKNDTIIIRFSSFLTSINNLSLPKDFNCAKSQFS